MQGEGIPAGEADVGAAVSGLAEAEAVADSEAMALLLGADTTRRATLCDMRTVTHREMRNQSGEILRHVADGETVQVTNHGRVAALIVPPGTDSLADLVSRGQVRVARAPASSLRSIVRRKSTADSRTILADVRGRW